MMRFKKDSKMKFKIYCFSHIIKKDKYKLIIKINYDKYIFSTIF